MQAYSSSKCPTAQRKHKRKHKSFLNQNTGSSPPPVEMIAKMSICCFILTSMFVSACQCGDGEILGVLNTDVRTDPTRLVFDDTPIATQRTSIVNIINDGNGPFSLLDGKNIHLEGEDVASFQIVQECPLPLLGQRFCVVAIQFSPLTEGAHTVQLVIPDARLEPNNETSDVRVVVQGQATPPVVRFDPDRLDFDVVNAGESISKEIDVCNDGTAELQFPVRMSGSGFLFEGRANIIANVEAGDCQRLTVDFSPPGAGIFTGTMQAELCGDGCGPTAGVRGEGLAPRIEVEPRILDFGTLEIGDDGRQRLTVRNVGVGVLQVEDLILDETSANGLQVSVVGGEALRDIVFPLEIAAGDEIRLQMDYEPIQPRAILGAQLLIRSTDPLSPLVRVPVQAVTPGAALEIAPRELDFGAVDIGQERQLDAIVRSVGTEPVILDAIDIVPHLQTLNDPRLQDGNAVNQYAFASILPFLPMVLSTGESIVLSLQTQPERAAVDAGGALALLQITGENGGEIGPALVQAQAPLSFSTGEGGCQPRLLIANAALGNMTVGQGAQGSAIVQNVGNAACTGGRIARAFDLPFDDGYSVTERNLERLDPGAVGEVLFGLQANTAGEKRAFVELHFAEHDALGLEPLLVSSNGRVLVGNLTLNPPVLSLNIVDGCPIPTRNVFLVNDSSETVSVTSIDVVDEKDILRNILQPDTFLLSENQGARALPLVKNPPVPVVPVDLFAGNAETLVVSLGGRPNIGTYTGTIAVESDLGTTLGTLNLQVNPRNSTVTDEFLVDGDVQSVDILFIIDNSGSMLDDQQQLADNFARFIEEASQGNGSVDFHIGITSTDVISTGAAAGRLLGNPTFLENTTRDLEAIFAERANVGIDGTGLELGLEAMRLALSEPLLGRENADFLRPEAALSVIVVSDEEDSAFAPEAATLAPQAARSVEEMELFLLGLKSGILSNAPVLFSAVTIPQAARYRELVTRTNGVALNIGDPNWGVRLGDLGEASFTLQKTFRLSNNADESTIVVTIDRVSVPFRYIEQSQSIVLREAPPVGSTVKVSYVPACP